MKITEATHQDISLIQNLARKSWENAYANIISKEQIDYMLGVRYSHQEISLHLQNPNYFYFIISDEQNPVGFIGFEHHYEPETTKLHRIYLIPEAKGRGFGKAGLTFLKNKTSEAKNKRIILAVNKQNPAKNVYESQGFKVYDSVVLDIGEGFVMDDFLMEFFL